MDGSISQRMFDGWRAQSELEDQLVETGVEFDRTSHDEYDCSLELHGVPTEQRLSEAAQNIIRDAGFAKVYVNHADKWETHYTVQDGAPVEGWRVSYPHKRRDGDESIWIEKPVPGWPKEWFDSGKAIVRPAPCKP